MNSKRIKIIVTTLILILCIYVLNVKEVSAAPNVKVKMSNKKVTIDTGKSKTINAKVTAGKNVNKKVRWSSTNRKVAVVDSNGKIKALRTGKAVIKATSKANKKVYAQCIVEVVINDGHKLKYDKLYFMSAPYFRNKVIKSYEELQKCKMELEKIYFSYKVDFTYMKEKLENYNEEYFEKNVLYLQRYVHGDGRNVFIDSVERVRKTSGSYIMRVTMKDEKIINPVDYSSVCAGYMVFIEAPKSYVKRIDKVQFKFISQNRQIH